MNKHVSHVMLCGCGWLGQPLATQLISQGMQVYGTTTRVNQLPTLNELGIKPHLFSVSKTSNANTEFSHSLLTDVSRCDVMVINIPPGRRDLDGKQFTDNMLELFNTVLLHQPTIHIIFVSTTSVFGHVTGQVDESTPPSPVTASGKAHHILEQWLFEHAQQQSTVVRLAGLINDSRHPVTSLVKRKEIENGHQVVNLVHQIDVVRGLVQIITQVETVSGHVLHFCAPEHPTREDYYQAAACSKELPPLNFISSKTTKSQNDKQAGKVVLAQKTQQLLSFNYHYPSPFDML